MYIFSARLAWYALVGFLLASFVQRALADTLTLTVKGPKNQVTSAITVNPAPIITNINCVPGTVTEGDPVSCVIIIDRPAVAPGLKLAVFGVPGLDSITVATGQTAATFTFLAAIPPQVPPPAAADFHPLLMPMHNGPALGLSTNLFLSMFYYQLLPVAGVFGAERRAGL